METSAGFDPTRLVEINEEFATEFVDSLAE
jgi:hypothetical protein